jgi:hypothetical protein
MPQPNDDLLWFRSPLGGAIHGFPRQGLAEAQANYAAIEQARAQKLPEPVFPRHPMDEIAAQIRGGKLIPSEPPVGVRTLELTEAQIAELEAQDRKESVAEKRARLLAELAELGEEEGEGPEDVPGSVGDVAGVSTEPGTTRGRGRTAKGGGQE